MFILDTNVLSELRQGEPNRGVVEWIDAHNEFQMFLSAMTVYELELGVSRKERVDPAQGRVLREWLETIVMGEFGERVLPIDERVAKAAARVQVPDQRPFVDCLIAATAMVHGAPVVTRNEKGFARVSGVSIINPWS